MTQPEQPRTDKQLAARVRHYREMLEGSGYRIVEDEPPSLTGCERR